MPCGKPVRSSGELRDYQGKVINTSGAHEFPFMVETVDGQPLVFRELGYLSDAVSSPLLSFGCLFQRLVHMMACRVCTMQTKS